MTEGLDIALSRAPTGGTRLAARRQVLRSQTEINHLVTASFVECGEDRCQKLSLSEEAAGRRRIPQGDTNLSRATSRIHKVALRLVFNFELDLLSVMRRMKG